jgi:hypothetical protein
MNTMYATLPNYRSNQIKQVNDIQYAKAIVKIFILHADYANPSHNTKKLFYINLPQGEHSIHYQVAVHSLYNQSNHSLQTLQHSEIQTKIKK